ncbi:CYTH domain-containing protein [Marinobacter sp. 1Y8]
MAEELEIKLTLPKACVDGVSHWLLQRASGAVSSRLLVNRYYDTPSLDLNRQHAALRIRQIGNRFIQTLKTQGEFVNGAHKRQEWEWDLASDQLDFGLLAETPLANNINLADLAVVFETNFERQAGNLESTAGTAECALDVGVVRSGNQEMALCEVEFELKSGSPEVLLDWARQLALEYPLFLNLVSKAEQGYWLSGLYAPAVSGSITDHVTGLLKAVSVLWLVGYETVDPMTIENAVSELLAEVTDPVLIGDLHWLQGNISGRLAPQEWLFKPEMLRLQLALITPSAV